MGVIKASVYPSLYRRPITYRGRMMFHIMAQAYRQHDADADTRPPMFLQARRADYVADAGNGSFIIFFMRRAMAMSSACDGYNGGMIRLGNGAGPDARSSYWLAMIRRNTIARIISARDKLNRRERHMPLREPLRLSGVRYSAVESIIDVFFRRQRESPKMPTGSSACRRKMAKALYASTI